MPPGPEFHTQCDMWVKVVIGSCPCSKDFAGLNSNDDDNDDDDDDDDDNIFYLDTISFAA